MFMYAQNLNGVWRELVGNIVFSPTVYQTAESLTEAQRQQFNVYFIADAPRPELLPSQKFGNPIYTISGKNVIRSYEIIQKTVEELEQDKQALVASIVALTQERLDAFARTRNYDGILSACTYASSAVPKFRDEGQYCVNARDTTWYALYQFMAEVEAGQRPVPTGYADVEPVLPALEWPV